jgi:DNA-binding transcriptional MerR regulator
MSPTSSTRYSLTELADLAGVTPRTVRYYLSQGLLPSPGASGPGAKYDDGHLGRLRLIRRLQREHLPLAEIRQRLAGLDDASVAKLASEPEAAPDPQDSALDYIRRVLGPPQATGSRLAGSTEAPRFKAYSLRAAPPPGMPLRVASTSEILPRTPPPQPMTLGVEPTPDRRFDRSQWERISLAPDIELHVRRPLPRPLAKQVDRLVSIARDLLEEDPS